ncbi:MAG: PTS sugar transporter subunit IIA [Thermofilum sp. ex4484_82]|nr:HPr family phosphocarrier protein [Thermoproteales archaeon]OYT27529.1 MAG: PTS sugar transporter subunit IIA [Thermofilum sp. ex4484_82]OYT37723.1 MAG: PTS sugar transporter subunit IIA [Archaeoglobales archaeon ex4484_92]RLE77670.1 MAG: HPr family phosphocarrier protein [Thermoprotei archaeon]
MLSVKVKLLNKVGLHARPAAQFVQTAKKFKSNITVCKDEQAANAKSILEILSLGAEYGDEILIQADGPDEKEAIKELLDLLEKFRREEG